MKVADIKMDRGSGALADIALWGCGSLKVLIDGLYDKAGEIDESPDDKCIVNEIFVIASLLETQTAAITSKLQDAERYFMSLERKLKEATA